jgi:hypothetical protein
MGSVFKTYRVRSAFALILCSLISTSALAIPTEFGLRLSTGKINREFCLNLIRAQQSQPAVVRAKASLQEFFGTEQNDLFEHPLVVLYAFYQFADEAARPELLEIVNELFNSEFPDGKAEEIKRNLKILFLDENFSRFAKKELGQLAELFPQNISRQRQMMRQLLALPKTIKSMAKIVKQFYTPEAFNENLYAFYGYHHNKTNDKHFKMRTWKTVPIKNAHPYLVHDISLFDMAASMIIAMEVEAGIVSYSEHNGRGLRILLPNLGKYMGKNEQEWNYVRRQEELRKKILSKQISKEELLALGVPESELPEFLSAEKNPSEELLRRINLSARDVKWCDNPWCREEHRHAEALETMVQNTTGIAPSRDNPDAAIIDTPDEDGAMHLVYHQDASEWGASSTYVMMAAHSEGELRDFLFNLLQDEVKHLTIASSAGVYLEGYRPWHRFWEMAKDIKMLLSSHKKTRSGGNVITKNPLIILELAIAHVLTEIEMRKWLKNLPVEVLREIYDTESELPELPAIRPPLEKQAEIDADLKRGWERRSQFARWLPKQREAARYLISFNDDHRDQLDEVVAGELGSFLGAEISGSEAEEKILEKITEVNLEKYDFSRKEDEAFRALLRGRLRRHQIWNNRHIRQ